MLVPWLDGQEPLYTRGGIGLNIIIHQFPVSPGRKVYTDMLRERRQSQHTSVSKRIRSKTNLFIRSTVFVSDLFLLQFHVSAREKSMIYQ